MYNVFFFMGIAKTTVGKVVVMSHCFSYGMTVNIPIVALILLAILNITVLHELLCVLV